MLVTAAIPGHHTPATSHITGTITINHTSALANSELADVERFQLPVCVGVGPVDLMELGAALAACMCQDADDGGDASVLPGRVVSHVLCYVEHRAIHRDPAVIHVLVLRDLLQREAPVGCTQLSAGELGAVVELWSLEVP